MKTIDVRGGNTTSTYVSIPVRGNDLKTLPFEKPYAERVTNTYFRGGSNFPVNKRQIIENFRLVDQAQKVTVQAFRGGQRKN